MQRCLVFLCHDYGIYVESGSRKDFWGLRAWAQKDRILFDGMYEILVALVTHGRKHLNFIQTSNLHNFCCEILYACKHSTKRTNIPKHCPTKDLLLEYKETSGKMCRPNLTEYISVWIVVNVIFVWLILIRFFVVVKNVMIVKKNYFDSK